MRNNKEIAKVVKATLAGDFDKIKIIDVRVAEEVNSDDETFLRIEVVFEGTPKDLDYQKLSRAVRFVRPKLEEIGEMAFPLFSFISKRDVGAGLEPA
jgi:hypothetical protein